MYSLYSFSKMSQCVKRKSVMGTMTQAERTLVFNLPNGVVSLMLGVSAEGPRRSTITHLIESRGVKIQYEDSRSILRKVTMKGNTVALIGGCRILLSVAAVTGIDIEVAAGGRNIPGALNSPHAPRALIQTSRADYRGSCRDAPNHFGNVRQYCNHTHNILGGI